MKKKSRRFRYIYGPVGSWRLGVSLGIDPLSSKGRICPFNCVYCQIGCASRPSDKRRVYVSTEDIVKEVKSLPESKVDYITFSGRGEPTLARNLGELIRAVRKIRKEKIAVLTNASLMHKKDVRDALLSADAVIAKIDAPSQRLFEKINRPRKGLRLNKIIRAIKTFKERFKGRLSLQIMFTNENKNNVNGLISVAEYIRPYEIQINTPLRSSGARPLSKKEILDIKKEFINNIDFKCNVISAYDKSRKRVKPLNLKDTARRRGE